MKPHPVSLVSLDLARVDVRDGFWGRRQQVLRERTLPSQLAHLESTGRIAALDPSFRPGDAAAHHRFWDSDIAKWMEAACCSLTTHPDPGLARRVETLVDAFARLQAADGYLNSWFLKVHPDRRWTNLRDDHELYCAGHLIEAAVAHRRATGNDRFLSVVRRYADLIAKVFGPGPGQRRGYPGHEEIELALVRLFEATKDRSYLDLARYFLDERGRRPLYFESEAHCRGDQPLPRWGGYDYYQSHVPVRKQDRAAGHAVRAMYLYAGMADVYRITGDRGLKRALENLWENVCGAQMYVTGSVGASGQGERFTFDYDLPEETSYCETCAAIGLVFWNQRMLSVSGDGRYADVIERALYNGVLSGISLSGDRYFYVNPLASLGANHRQDWFGCACCPPNIARLLASLGGCIFSEGDEAWVHLFTNSRAQLDVAGGPVAITQKTDYPWDGRVDLTIDPERERPFVLNLRLPGWCRRAAVAVNGRPLDLSGGVKHGYAHIDRTWRPGDRLRLDLPMPVERLYAHPSVRMAAGKVALQRGPVVYCVEETDTGVTPLSRLVLPRETEVRPVRRDDLLEGVVTLTADACATDSGRWDGVLYRTEPHSVRPASLTAIPYYAWDNRDPGQMIVWLREGQPGDSP